jgi:alpha-ketoglutarate-dependent taurine dioxygenase
VRILYALIPSYVSGELWQNPPLLRLLSEIIANAKEALQREGIILAVIEPALSLHHVTLAEGLSLMQTYCHLSDCVVSFDRVYDQYPSPLIDFMFMSAREQGRPIIAADCVRPALGERNSLVDALALVAGTAQRPGSSDLRLTSTPTFLPRLMMIDPNLDLLLHPDGSVSQDVPAEMGIVNDTASTMRFTKIPGSFAVEVNSVSCDHVTAEQIRGIRRKLDEHRLLIFRNQNLSSSGQVAFTSFFGTPDMAWDNRNRDHNEARVQIISNQYKGGEYHYDRTRRMSTVRYWHADTSFLANPTRYTFLFIQKIPEKYGLSEFANTKLGYEGLPNSLKEAASNKEVCHSFDYIFGELLRLRSDERPEPVPDVVHPLVWRSESGDSLYLSELSQSHIVGLSKAESDKLITQVMEHCKQMQFRHTHLWRPGDFLVWDNLAIMHRSGFADPEYERVLHRTTVTVQDALPIEPTRGSDIPVIPAA